MNIASWVFIDKYVNFMHLIFLTVYRVHCGVAVYLLYDFPGVRRRRFRAEMARQTLPTDHGHASPADGVLCQLQHHRDRCA